MASDTNQGHGPSYWIEDGKHCHIMRQSELSSYIGTCSEQVRRDRAEPEMRRETDAAAIGTACHAAIQTAIDLTYAGGTPVLGDLVSVARKEFATIEQMPNFFWVSHDAEKASKYITAAVTRFYNEVLPTLHPMGTEIPFRRLVLHEDDQRIIYANGTIDYHDYKVGLVDWKTASRKYQPWEKQRWNLQSIMYPWAAKQIGELQKNDPWDFTFIVFVHGGDIQTIKVERTELHHQWMKQQALQMAYQVEANLPTWNMNDNGWWCHGKWCPHFAGCKGALIAL